MSNCPADCTPSPNAVNDTAITDEDVAIEIDVLANDTTPVGTLNPASVTVTMAPANGATSVNVATGAITYTPALDHFGTDQFIYQVCHTLSRCDTATVSITINGINDPPYANDDTVTTDEDVAIEINVLANDTDDGTLDPTSVTVITPPQQGLVTIDATTGAVTYTPNLDYNGADTLVYQVCDNDSTCSTATVFITITPVDDPPTANPDEIHVQINTQAAFNPVANDTDPDSILDPCAVMLITQPTNGAATLDASCRTIYTPLVGFTGTDSFNYQICDDTGLCANSTITLIVSPNPPQPTAAPQPTTFDPALSKAGPASAAVIGELIPWSITASNTGIQTTEAYTFSDPVPPTFDIRDVVVNGKATYFISGNTITFNVEPLEPGEQVHITVNTIANQQARPGQACNSLAPAQSANSTACAMLYPNTLPAAGERTRLRIVVPSIGILAALAGGSWLIKKRR
ncbi:MAG: tandem-95 repeat protein [Anaerolineae bacterium]|nr:tandem-95 repeat protein [Anaerolineae bacterium]